MARSRRVVLPLATALVIFGTHAALVPAMAWAPPAWSWPVVGPVIQGFDPPATPYGAGHRGIDIAVPVGTAVMAPASGVVRFAGPIGGELFVSVDHGGGIVSSYSWLSEVAVARGDAVFEGTVMGFSGPGHPGVAIAHLHFGVRLHGVYIDPLTMLLPLSVVDLIRLAPIPVPGRT